jgi:hypothetical protein
MGLTVSEMLMYHSESAKIADDEKQKASKR